MENNDLFSAVGLQVSPFPKTLSHYTSLDGFLSIVQSHTIRASNILFLNDREEMEYGMNVAREVLAEVDLLGPAPKKASRQANQVPDVYACCFCAEPDMLSQWRGYGANGQSVSIQFDGSRLAALARKHQFDLHAVVYGKKRAMELLRSNLANAESNVELMRAITDKTDLDAADLRRARILDLAPRFKNGAFTEEQEWRIIAKGHVVKNVQYRVRDNVIMPYVNVSDTSTGLPMTKVIVGPGKDAALTRKSIEKFLSQTIFYSDVDVSVSSIPFRT